MRFIHMADVHLGAAPDKGYPWSQRRSEELWQTFQQAVQSAEEEQADLLLIAGDLFHRQPLMREIKEVNALFGRLRRTQVVLIAGNHDYLRPDSPASGFMWAENVIFLDSPDCEKVFFPELETTVYGLSYHSREIPEPLYDDLCPDGNAGCHILLAHGGDAQHIPFDRRRLSESGFDYVALGHIHKPQSLVEDQMAYAGALEPIDGNDTGPHGYIFGEYRNGRVITEFVPFACRQYEHLKIVSGREMTDGLMRRKIAELIAAHGAEHIYKIRIEGYRDPDIIYRTDSYMELGNILEAADETVPDYDFEELYARHRGDIIGRYMEKMMPGETDSEHQQKIRTQALYYGLRALQTGNDQR